MLLAFQKGELARARRFLRDRYVRVFQATTTFDFSRRHLEIEQAKMPWDSAEKAVFIAREIHARFPCKKIGHEATGWFGHGPSDPPCWITWLENYTPEYATQLRKGLTLEEQEWVLTSFRQTQAIIHSNFLAWDAHGSP